MTYFQIFTSLLPIICTLVSVYVVVRAFNRNRRFDNENTLFKFKIEAYFIIIDKIIELLDIIREPTDYLDTDSTFSKANLIHDKSAAVINAVLHYSLILPERIMNQLDILRPLIRPHNENLDEPEKTENLIAMDEKNHYPEILKNLDILHEEMRKDLGAEKLNKNFIEKDKLKTASYSYL